MMTTENMNSIFETLKRIGACKSRSDFSTRWLGREESYFRSIQAKGLEPSIQAHAHLAAHLRTMGVYLSNSEFPTLVATGKAYLALFDGCLEALLTRAQDETAISRDRFQRVSHDQA